MPSGSRRSRRGGVPPSSSAGGAAVPLSAPVAAVAVNAQNPAAVVANGLSPTVAIVGPMEVPPSDSLQALPVQSAVVSGLQAHSAQTANGGLPIPPPSVMMNRSTSTAPLIIVPSITPVELAADVLLQEDSLTVTSLPRLAYMTVPLYCYPSSAISRAGNLLLGMLFVFFPAFINFLFLFTF